MKYKELIDIIEEIAPTEDYREFINGEGRYNSLVRKNPERAERLFAAAEEDSKAKWTYLNRLIELYKA